MNWYRMSVKDGKKLWNELSKRGCRFLPGGIWHDNTADLELEPFHTLILDEMNIKYTRLIKKNNNNCPFCGKELDE